MFSAALDMQYPYHALRSQRLMLLASDETKQPKHRAAVGERVRGLHHAQRPHGR